VSCEEDLSRRDIESMKGDISLLDMINLLLDNSSVKFAPRSCSIVSSDYFFKIFF